MPPQTATYDGFGGGVNTLVPARDLADDEVASALNMELHQQTVLRARRGLTLLAGGLAGHVTSLRHFSTSGGAETVLVTAGNRIYRMPVGGGTATDVTGALSLPSGTPWQWVVMGDKAIGVNRSADVAHANPVVLVSPSATAATALGGSAPKSLYAEVFNSRLFLVSATEPNRLHYSTLGDAADFTTTGKAGSGSILVGGNEGDFITGIKSHLGRLFIFKRTRIYVLLPGSPNTDNQQWVIDMLTDRVGGYGSTVQPVINDLVFLSDHGVMSLQAVQQVADFKHAVLSAKIVELRSFDKSAPALASVNHADALQYWVAVPEAVGSSTNTATWVMDYSGLAGKGSASWTKFSGGVVGSSYASVIEDGRIRVYVGNAGGVYRYGDDTVFTDAGTVYEKRLWTKAYSPGPSLIRKEFHRYGFELGADSNGVILDVTYRLDEDSGVQKIISAPLGEAHSGSKWGLSKWGTAKFATSGSRGVDFISSFRGTAGRRGQTVQFRLHNAQNGGFSIQRVTLVSSLLALSLSGDVVV